MPASSETRIATVLVPILNAVPSATSARPDCAHSRAASPRNFAAVAWSVALAAALPRTVRRAISIAATIRASFGAYNTLGEVE